VGHSLFPFLSSRSQTLVSALGLQALIYLRFSSGFTLIDLYYDNLGVRIEGELPDGTPHLIICE
jgi:hypothetical protein